MNSLRVYDLDLTEECLNKLYSKNNEYLIFFPIESRFMTNFTSNYEIKETHLYLYFQGILCKPKTGYACTLKGGLLFFYLEHLDNYKLIFFF